MDPPQARRRSESLKIKTAEFVRSVLGEGDFLRGRYPEVAFAGRSNVGKSSLMNRLMGRKGLARTSSAPGRTRSVNYFLINDRYYFVDLPGYGYAAVGREERRGWARWVDQYLHWAGSSTQVVLLVDGKVGATPLDVQALGYLSGLGAKVVVAATKIDRVSRGRRAGQLAQVRAALGLNDSTRLIAVSARSGEGMRGLWKEIDLHLLGKARSTA
jgi:GTP-binding protein